MPFFLWISCFNTCISRSPHVETVSSSMFRCAPRLFTFSRRAATARYFHRVTADFINCDVKGKPVSTKVPIVIGNPGESYVQIDPEIGWAFHAGSLHNSPSATNVEGRCRLTFVHETQHFGFGRCAILSTGPLLISYLNSSINSLSSSCNSQQPSSQVELGYKSSDHTSEWNHA